MPYFPLLLLLLLFQKRLLQPVFIPTTVAAAAAAGHVFGCHSAGTCSSTLSSSTACLHLVLL
jgi:hypothetical protein